MDVCQIGMGYGELRSLLLGCYVFGACLVGGRFGSHRSNSVDPDPVCPNRMLVEFGDARNSRRFLGLPLKRRDCAAQRINSFIGEF